MYGDWPYTDAEKKWNARLFYGVVTFAGMAVLFAVIMMILDVTGHLRDGPAPSLK